MRRPQRRALTSCTSYTGGLAIRSWVPCGVVGGALLLEGALVGACASPNFGPDEETAVLPDRAPLDPVEASRPDTNRPDTAVGDARDAADTAPVGLRVFVSSSTSKGNLGGMAGAALVCRGLATAAGLAGTWVAWLSNNNGLFPDAIEHVTSTGPWRLVSGEIVASTKAELISETTAVAPGGPRPAP